MLVVPPRSVQAASLKFVVSRAQKGSTAAHHGPSTLQSHWKEGKARWAAPDFRVLLLPHRREVRVRLHRNSAWHLRQAAFRGGGGGGGRAQRGDGGLRRRPRLSDMTKGNPRGSSFPRTRDPSKMGWKKKSAS